MFEEDTTLTEAAIIEINDPDSETDRLEAFEMPKREESDLQASKTVTPVIQDTELEPLEGGTIVVDRRPHTMRPRSIAQQESDDQEAIDHQLLLQEQPDSNTQRGADVATRRSARLLQSEKDRQPRL